MTMQNRRDYSYPDYTGKEVRTEDSDKPNHFDHSLYNYHLRKLYTIKRPGNNGRTDGGDN